MATKKIYETGVLASTFLHLLLNSFDLPSYDSDSRKIHTNAVVDVSKGRGWWKLLCQGASDLTWEGFALGELNGRKKLWFNEIPTG